LDAIIAQLLKHTATTKSISLIRFKEEKQTDPDKRNERKSILVGSMKANLLPEYIILLQLALTLYDISQ
jgi:hypothetical protein